MAISQRFQDRFEAFMRARLAEELHRDPEPSFRGAITVSRETGARAFPICELLADYLTEEDESTEHGWTVHDKDIVESIIEKESFPRTVKKHLREDKTLFDDIVETVRSIARLGNAIIIGRGGNFITACLQNTFHIRLVGSESARIAHLQRSRSLERRDATTYLKRIDEARRDYVRSHLNQDVADPLNYHAIVRTDGVADEVVARMVGDLYMDWAVAKAETAGKLIAMP